MAKIKIPIKRFKKVTKVRGRQKNSSKRSLYSEVTSNNRRMLTSDVSDSQYAGMSKEQRRAVDRRSRRKYRQTKKLNKQALTANKTDSQMRHETTRLLGTEAIGTAATTLNRDDRASDLEQNLSGGSVFEGSGDYYGDNNKQPAMSKRSNSYSSREEE